MERLHSSSSIGLAGWGNPTLPQSGFTLFIRVHSAQNLQAVGRGSYCKLYLGNTEVVNGSSQAGASFSNLLAVDSGQQNQSQVQVLQGPTHRVFRTKVVYTDQKSRPEWNEKLELHVLNPDTEILTIRVKNQLMLFCPAVGACAVPLRNITVGQSAEQWFPLYKGGKAAGHIRLQLMLQQKDPVVTPAPSLVNESPMQRLIQLHCQQERERRQETQNDENMRRRQFEAQERLQLEMRRQREEDEEKERRRMEDMAKMQAYHDQMQRDEQAKVQAYLQKQMQHEEDWHAEGISNQMREMKVEIAPEEGNKNDSYHVADDMATASTSRRSSNTNQSFTGSMRDEYVAEAVELTDVVLGEVVHDALPSSGSTSSAEDTKRHSKRKEEERRSKHSRKHSRSEKDIKSKRSEAPLFPKAPEEVPQETVSSASLEDSSSSDESSSSEEERRRRRRRRRKEKKARRRERRRRHKAKRKARRESDGYESSSSSSSVSSSSSSSSSSSDERRKRKARKHNKTKKRAKSQLDVKARTMPRATIPPHSKSYGPDHFNNAKGSTNQYDDPPPAYARPTAQSQYSSGKSPGYIESLPPQQQKRSMGEMISTAADVASILSDVASVATSVQQLAGGGNAGGGGGGGIPFAMTDMSQLLAGQDLSGLAGQDFSGLVGSDTAQYY